MMIQIIVAALAIALGTATSWKVFDGEQHLASWVCKTELANSNELASSVLQVPYIRLPVADGLESAIMVTSRALQRIQGS